MQLAFLRHWDLSRLFHSPFTESRIWFDRTWSYTRAFFIFLFADTIGDDGLSIFALCIEAEYFRYKLWVWVVFISIRIFDANDIFPRRCLNTIVFYWDILISIFEFCKLSREVLNCSGSISAFSICQLSTRCFIVFVCYIEEVLLDDICFGWVNFFYIWFGYSLSLVYESVCSSLIIVESICVGLSSPFCYLLDNKSFDLLSLYWSLWTCLFLKNSNSDNCYNDEKYCYLDDCCISVHGISEK